MTRVTVFGAGAVGGYLAWHMGHAGVDVSVVARGAHLDAIKLEGLTLQAQGEPAGTVRVTATDEPRSLGVQDVVFVTLKQPSVAASVEGLKALSAPDTKFVFITNGVPWWMEPELDFLDPRRQLATLIPTARRVGAVARISSHVEAPGRVATDAASARFILGPGGDGASAATQEIVALLEGAGVEATFAANLRPAIWDKLYLNLGFGLLAAIMGLQVGQVASQPEARQILADLLEEIRRLASSRGVAMTLADSVITDPAIRASSHMPSLLQDLLKARPAEIDALVIAPLALARSAGLSTPVLDIVAALITTKARALGSYAFDGMLHIG